MSDENKTEDEKSEATPQDVVNAAVSGLEDRIVTRLEAATREQLGTTQKAFRDAADEKAEVEAKGKAVDPLLEDRIENIAKAMDQEDDRIEELRREQKAIRRELEMENRMSLESTADRKHRDQFLALMRDPEYAPNEDMVALRDRAGIRAAFESSDNPELGWTIPRTTRAGILTLIRDEGMVGSSPLVMWETCSGNTYEYTIDRDEDYESGWVGETQSRPDTEGQGIDQRDAKVHEIYAQPKATRNQINDSAWNIERWIQMKVAKAFNRRREESFINGNGVKKPVGLITWLENANKRILITDNGAGTSAKQWESDKHWGMLAFRKTGVAGDFKSGGEAADVLMAVESDMRQQKRAGSRWLLNRHTRRKVRQFKDGDGNYLMERALDTGVTTLLGHELVESDFMPNVEDDKFPIILAGAGSLLGLTSEGIMTLRDPYTDKPYIRYYTTMRFGFDILDFQCIIGVQTAD